MVWISGDINYKSNCVSYVLADVIVFVYEVPFIFWHHIYVDEVSWITLKKIITKCDGIITICDSLVYYKVRWTVITNCDSFFITKCDTVYYKLRQVLQSAMVIANCDSTCTGTRSVFTRAFGQKENFNAYSSAKRRSLLHPNTAQR